MAGYKNPSFGKTTSRKPIMRAGKPESASQLAAPGVKPSTTPPSVRPTSMRNLSPWKGFNPGKK